MLSDQYALLILSIRLFDFFNEFLKYLDKCAHEIGTKSSSTQSNQSQVIKTKSAQSFKDVF